MAITRKKFDIIETLHKVERNRDRINAFTDVLTTEAAKNDFGRKIIARIKERTAEGIDKNGRKFTKHPAAKGGVYSPGYVAARVFRLYGKSNQTINMKLTGAMLASMDVLSTGSTSVEIGFNLDSQERKARGHITGEVFKNNIPRDFLGLPDDDLKAILTSIIRNAQPSINQRSIVELALGRAAFNDAATSESDVLRFLAVGEFFSGQ